MTTFAAGIVCDVAEKLLLLARSSACAEAVEWVAAPTLKLREQVTRASSEHADPTGTVATDERGLALRARTDKARAVLGAARIRLWQARHELDREVASSPTIRTVASPTARLTYR